MTTTPPPGSPEAVEQGCKCPVIDNHYGKGYMGQEGVYAKSTSCPIHPTHPWTEQDERDRARHRAGLF